MESKCMTACSYVEQDGYSQKTKIFADLNFRLTVCYIFQNLHNLTMSMKEFKSV